jgi:hypothetical protein
VVCYIFHTKAAAVFQGVLFLVLAWRWFIS